ncbi:MAG: type I methionyl aminopeptidase [Candidatus Ryanbacteria bacterium RIFCSPHIGHO2_02_FULL_45_43]|uniref:Methionine aminopeptidase n=1 Tax=Candidatus Ryanbacteria bacterium RIFCSPHIGHO2_01_45_13 TaxID=1802112 RepID=A0A1G2FWL2_9BACT|nr:MAG: type I methionyl aminopeptidase [Candidatus Ryanbacteria bacterium RIFCSPHIGHO2_01_FULL_44_130]OGZ42453.1 MAG: type I methionyl aminopeptidase [Candidatus Ryanbacteria bacterium RIFCSPHIGHO2_01_45_13]OGZ48470.1 MAG: type I methionyl aminopeptidase [Candidatus Ryanbacteria bacterium RIFCSPHIGHO2_02_FULL_45_43]OGZ50335.1 MAG: type I methionyl aminopeptidase [Candidatus Ryanbacteria bacterium RIFCSPHIGHO2_12_FULL_44_20]OGZ51674.1 MAG: type I methionyl aminopeptidase [Candidatus Ryanbacteri
MIARLEKEVRILKEGGKILSGILSCVCEIVRAGVTTKELDALAEQLIFESGATPSFNGYIPKGAKGPYPATLCTSVNEELVHAIPSERILRSGDIIGLDVGMQYKGLFTDMAVTIGVGNISDELRQLLQVTKTALERGIKAACIGGHVGDIGHAIESYVQKYGYGIVRELVGHGVGQAAHEEPQVPNHGKRGSGPKLLEGMVLAIEPMVTLGAPALKLAEDGWAWVTEDGKPSAHFEHTILVTKNGAEVLTT